MRKPIQITSVMDDNMQEVTVYALCDDGTIFFLEHGIGAKWSLLPDIPQDTKYNLMED